MRLVRPRTVVLCRVGECHEKRVARLLGRMDLRFVDPGRTLIDVLGDLRTAPVIVTDASSVADVAGLLGRRPEVGVVGVTASEEELPCFARLGIEYVFPHDHAISALEAMGIAHAASWQGITNLACRDARALFPARVHPISDTVLQSRRVTRVAGIAASIGVHRHTVRHWCRQAGISSAERLVTWCRLLLAAAAIDVGGYSVDNVAYELAYSSPTGLRNQLKRYCGLTGSEIRSRGRASVLATLRSELQSVAREER